MYRLRSATMEEEKVVQKPALIPSPPSPEEELKLAREALEAAQLAEAGRRAVACRVVAVGFSVLFVVLLVFKALGETPDEKRAFSSHCMATSGGGLVGPRGSLLHFDPRCTAELQEYFDQAYFAEVRRVADEATSYFRGLVARQQRQDEAEGAGPRGSRGVVVFDIDETALSNMDGFFSRTAPWSRLFGVGGATYQCTHPHLEFMPHGPAGGPPSLLLLAGTAAGGGGGGVADGLEEARTPLCSSPPLRAVLDLYTFLHANNFTLVFLTGRSEDARTDTEANLEDAGYGALCTAPSSASKTTTTFTSDRRRAHAHRRHLAARDVPQDSASASSASASSSSSASASSPASSSALSPPCYAQLLMRRVGDERLASVFKAEARAALLAGGGGDGQAVIVGNIGDQFSDLVGEAAGAASFKLPNPVYTLL